MHVQYVHMYMTHPVQYGIIEKTCLSILSLRVCVWTCMQHDGVVTLYMHVYRCFRKIRLIRYADGIININ